MPWWLGNPIALSVFVLISTGVALAIGSHHRGDVHFWRPVETGATILGGVSLLLLSFNVEHVFALRYFDGFRLAYVGASSRLTSEADFVPRFACDTKFKKDPTYSPPNFDDIVSDQARVCEWSKKIRTIVSKVNFANLDPIDKSWFALPEQKTAYWKSDFQEYAEGATDYIEFRNKALELKSESEMSDLKLVTLAFAPYFLGIALATQLAKVRYK
jgi:hypothetical protein